MEDDLVDLEGVQLALSEAVNCLAHVLQQLTQPSLVIGRDPVLRRATRLL